MKKILAIFISMIMILPMLIVNGVSAETTNANAKLTLFAPRTAIGETGTMTIGFENTSGKDITIESYTVTGFNDYGVTRENGSCDDIENETVADNLKTFSAGEDASAFATVKYVARNTILPLLSVTVNYKIDGDTDSTPISDSCVIETYDSSNPNANKPDLVIDKISTKSSIEAGSDFTLYVYLKNTGDSTAKNIYVTVSNYDSNTFYPKTVNADVKEEEISSGDRESINIGIRTSKKLPTGTYPLNITYTYQDENKEMQTGTGKCYVNINNPDPTAGNPNETSLTLTSLKSSTSTVTSGEDFTLTFDITNLSKSPASNVNIGINNYTTDTFIPSSLNTVSSVGTIEGSSKKTYSIKICTSSVMKTGHFPLDIGYTYTDDDGNLCRGNYTTFISVLNPKAPEETADGIKTTPRIILDKYALDVDNVIAGKPFTFSFSLKNTNTKVNVSNMKISVESTDGIFTPVQGSNSFYTASLATGQSEDYSISLTTKSGCVPDSYPILIKIDYEDTNGSSYSSTENINLLVTQPVRVEIMDFNPPTEMPMGMPLNISFRYFNKGKTSLNNFSICMEGDFSMERGDEYIGALGASSYDEYQGMIFASGTGEQNGILVLKFEDSTGTEQRIEKPFSVNISEESFDQPVDEPMFPDDGMGEIIDWDEDGNPIFASTDKSDGLAWWVITLICVGGAAVITVVVIIIVKKAKKKKQQNLDADDDDDDDYDEE